MMALLTPPLPLPFFIKKGEGKSWHSPNFPDTLKRKAEEIPDKNFPE